LRFQGSQGSWYYQDGPDAGARVEFSIFQVNEPNGGDIENCVLFIDGGYDFLCDAAAYAVIEYECPRNMVINDNGFGCRSKFIHMISFLPFKLGFFPFFLYCRSSLANFAIFALSFGPERILELLSPFFSLQTSTA
jgi:hypothetical protein